MARFGISFQSDKSIAEYRELGDMVAHYDFETASVYQDLLFQPPWPALFQFAERTRTPLIGPAVVNIIRQTEELFESGVDLYEFGTPHGVDEGEAIRLLGEEVLPYFFDAA